MGLLEKFRRFPLRIAGIIALLLDAVVISVHILVMLKVLPFHYVNGGRYVDFNEAFVSSIASIAILALFALVHLFGSGILPLQPGKLAGAVHIALWLIVLFAVLSTVMQLLGTPFEKNAMAPAALLLFLSTLRLAIEKQK